MSFFIKLHFYYTASWWIFFKKNGFTKQKNPKQKFHQEYYCFLVEQVSFCPIGREKQNFTSFLLVEIKLYVYLEDKNILVSLLYFCLNLLSGGFSLKLILYFRLSVDQLSRWLRMMPRRCTSRAGNSWWSTATQSSSCQVKGWSRKNNTFLHS